MSKAVQVGDWIPAGAVGTAGQEDVLEDVTFSSYDGIDLPGLMPNHGNPSKTITTQNGKHIIVPGYYSGGSVMAQITNLIARNIRRGVDVGGIVGEFGGNVEAHWDTTEGEFKWSGNEHYVEAPFEPDVVLASLPYWEKLYVSGLNKLLPTSTSSSRNVNYASIDIGNLFNNESDPYYKIKTKGNGLVYRNRRVYLKPETFGDSFTTGATGKPLQARIVMLKKV